MNFSIEKHYSEKMWNFDVATPFDFCLILFHFLLYLYLSIYYILLYLTCRFHFQSTISLPVFPLSITMHSDESFGDVVALKKAGLRKKKGGRKGCVGFEKSRKGEGKEGISEATRLVGCALLLDVLHTCLSECCRLPPLL